MPPGNREGAPADDAEPGDLPTTRGVGSWVKEELTTCRWTRDAFQMSCDLATRQGRLFCCQ